MSAEKRSGYIIRKSFTEILLPFEIPMSMLITDQNYITLKTDFETTALGYCSKIHNLTIRIMRKSMEETFDKSICKT